MSNTNFTIANKDLIEVIADHFDRGISTATLMYELCLDYHDELVDVAFYILNDHNGGVDIEEDGSIPFDAFSDCFPDEVMDTTMFDYQCGFLNSSGYSGDAENFELAQASLLYMSHTFQNVSDLVKREQF